MNLLPNGRYFDRLGREYEIESVRRMNDLFPVSAIEIQTGHHYSYTKDGRHNYGDHLKSNRDLISVRKPE